MGTLSSGTAGERGRQDARLTLAKDRATGSGRGTSEAVTQAWEACFFHDPTSEEAAFALMRLYAAQLKWGLVETTYNRCRSALEELGLMTSPALERARAANGPAIASARSAGAVRGTVQPDRDRDQRIVTCVFIDLGAPPAGGRLGPEDLSDRVGNVLAETVGSVESFGGISRRSPEPAWLLFLERRQRTRTTLNADYGRLTACWVASGRVLKDSQSAPVSKLAERWSARF